MTKQPNSLADTLRTLLPVLLIELALSALMVGVYALLGRFSGGVVLGAALGTALAVLNFVAMVVSLLRAERAGVPAKGQLASTGSYIFRMIVLAAVLVLVLKTGYFDPVATLLPLVFFRIAIMLSELFHKKGADGK